jgi:FtsP/CotA-like multicopper oxidase with cupredoxin domain
MAAHPVDLGGGASAMGGHHHGGVSIADLRGGPVPAPGEPVRRFTLTARMAAVQLAGRTVEAWTFDGQVPGPPLRVRQGELVEVTLHNADIAAGVTLHWHGYPVPNGEDGVAGVTQDAVPPGGEFVYRFRANQPGTYWYHSHQRSAEAVRRGLFGTLVVEPPDPTAGLDLTVPIHTIGGTMLTGAVDGLDRRSVPPGTPVRLRLVNTDDSPHMFALRGTAFRLAAVDGAGINGTGITGAELAGDRLPLAAGGRYDLVFTMPTGPVQLAVDGRNDRGLLLSADLTATPPPGPDVGPVLDITRYGTAQALPSRFDREFTLVLDRQLRFLDGVPRSAYTVGGRVYPNIPSQLVREGELVRFTIVNRGSEPHPMHPHGHRVQVLSRNGVPATGAVWTDSFEVGPGEVWQVALRADNPGIWMSHCHNLKHAAEGMVLHLIYDGVRSPYVVGHSSSNHPE